MKIVVALGGNALGSTPEEQKELVKNTAKSIADIIQDGHQVVLTHGNGPQVGMINLAFGFASDNNEKIPSMPFAECGAMSQGYIGYHLQAALSAELKRRNIDKTVVSLVTQVVVSPTDQGFTNPTKPIGAFYSKIQADELTKLNGYTMKDFGDIGWRRVVASPKPIDIVEKDAVSALLQSGQVVITVGGGGIPVIEKDDEYFGVPAVIDKDFASALVAKLINADKLIILTAIDKVCVNFGKPNQKELDNLSVKEAEEYIKQDQFGKGSMLPKVLSAVDFVKDNPRRQAIIANLNKSGLAISGKSGTVIHN